ncbi:MAG TPA: metalloregulator ArsR/SmtB family transcription factor [Alphaproteobacteria bacterium]
MTYEAKLAALADPTRRAVFERVVKAPRSVGELTAGLPVSRPAVSQHLKVLKDAGLVRETRAGTRRVYRADPEALGERRAYVESMWRAALDGFAAEDNADPGSGKRTR